MEVAPKSLDKQHKRASLKARRTRYNAEGSCPSRSTPP
jgi:hypothetical protein